MRMYHAAHREEERAARRAKRREEIRHSPAYQELVHG
jgi:hypothetical protein